MKTAIDYVTERVEKLLEELSTVEKRREELQKIVPSNEEETKKRIREARQLQSRMYEIQMTLKFIPA